MDFHVIIPSRGNPLGCAAVSKCLRQLQSGIHCVDYTWLCDTDDKCGYEYKNLCNMSDADVFFEDPEENLYKRINNVADDVDAEMTLILGDDVYPLTQFWDMQAALINSPVFSWKEYQNPNSFTYMFVHREWRLLQGYTITERFPFWFADSWLAENFIMTTDCAIVHLEHLVLGGQRGKTKQLRDLKFWFEYFEATRCIRIQESERMKKDKVDPVIIKSFEEVDETHHPKLQLYEDYHGTPGDIVSPRYLKLKKEAELWMKEHCV